MNAVSLRLSRIAIVALIALAALCLWVPRQRKFQESRQGLFDAQMQLAALSNRIASAAETLESAQRDLNTETSSRTRLVAEVAKAERALALVAPETRWAVPPASLPEWNPESPYIWLRKEMVPRFPVSPFTEDGALQPEVSYVFTLDPALQKTLNEKLKQILAEYRTLEAAKAERSDEHLPGIAGQPGPKITIRVKPLPEEGARIKQQFEAALVQGLGEQRAKMLSELGDSWLDSQFAQFGADTKIISAIRNPGGSYNVSVKTGRSWFSTGGPLAAVTVHIPPHLRPLFAEVLAPDNSTDSAKASQ
jgi:hypothetical protein